MVFHISGNFAPSLLFPAVPFRWGKGKSLAYASHEEQTFWESEVGRATFSRLRPFHKSAPLPSFWGDEGRSDENAVS